MRILIQTILMLLCVSLYGQTKSHIPDRDLIDSLKIELQKNPTDSQKVEMLYDIAREFRSMEADSMVFYSKRIIEFSDKYKFSYGLMLGLNGVVNGYCSNFEYSKAIEELQKYKVFFESNEDVTKDDLATYYKALADVYFSLREYHLALKYILKVESIYKELGDKEEQAYNCGWLGIIYVRVGDYDIAKAYQKNAINLFVELEDVFWEAFSYINLADVYEHVNQYDSALLVSYKALDLFYSIEDGYGIGYGYKTIGDYQILLDSIEEGILSYKTSLDHFERPYHAWVNLSLGEILYDQQKYAEALQVYLDAYTVSLEISDLNENVQASKGMYKCYQELGDYKAAYNSLLLFNLYSDSLDKSLNKETALKNEAILQFQYLMKTDSLAHVSELSQKEVENERIQLLANQRKRTSYFLYAGLLLTLVFGGVIFNRLRITRRQKQEIEQQKKLIEIQKVEVEKTHRDLELTHDELGEKHKEITDSINYAERIQRSFLATQQMLDANLKDYFVMFQPKEAVSGDFYWAHQFEDGSFTYITADSTGHGVPGAIMSILNISSLEKSVETNEQCDQILGTTRQIIINRLKKDGSPEGGKDGMDCSLVKFNADKTRMTLASAHNAVWVVREGELIEFKGDKIPVGKHDRDNESFTLQTFDLQKGDVIYTTTDGFPDQFGGENGKKFMVKKMKELLISLASKPMVEQKSILEQTFNDWKHNQEQIDDVCVIGVRV